MHTHIDIVLHGCDKHLNFINHNISLIKKNAPWIHKIFVIITPETQKDIDKIPKDSNVTLIDYKTFVPKKYHASYMNSCVIESWLWRLSNLSDMFLYACDDMFIGQNVKKEDFFLNDKPLVRMWRTTDNVTVPDHKVNLKNKIPYVQMFSNAIQQYDIHFTQVAHNIQPFRKSNLKKYYQMYKEVVDKASENKIRSGSKDFNLLRIGSSLSIMHGDAYMTSGTEDFFCESDEPEKYKTLLKKTPKFFCINNLPETSKEISVILNKLLS